MLNYAVIRLQCKRYEKRSKQICNPNSRRPLKEKSPTRGGVRNFCLEGLSYMPYNKLKKIYLNMFGAKFYQIFNKYKSKFYDKK